MSTTLTQSHDQIEAIQVLHVDDDSSFADMAATFIQREDDRFTVETVTSASEGLDRLNGKQFDCIVSDYDMPGQNGIDFLQAVRETHPHLPFILFTGKGSEEVASEAISAGVSDYLQKGLGTERYSLLANRIRNLVSQSHAETRLETRAEQQRRVAELGQKALAGAPPESLFEQAVTMVAETLDNEYAKVLKYRPAHEDVLLRAGTGWQDGLVGEATVGTGKDSQAGHTLRSEKPIVVDDLQAEQRFRGPPLLIEHDVASGISVIIGSDDDPWGVLGTHSTAQKTFTQDDINFVQNVANVLANAINRTAHEQELQRKERRYQAVFNDPNILVGLIDIDGTVRDINQTALEYIDATLDDVTGELFWETPWFDHAEAVQEEVKDWINRAAAGEYVEFEVDLVRPNGEPYTVAGVFRPVTNDDGEVVSLLISDRDITERKQRELELQRYEKILESIDDIPFVVGTDWTVEYISETIQNYGDISRDDVVGELVMPLAEEFFVDEDDSARFEAALSRAFEAEVATEPPQRLELTVEFDGEEIIFEYQFSPLVEEGETSAVVITMREITQRKQQEQKIQQTNTLLSILFEALPQGVLVEDESRTVLTANQQMFDLFEMPGSSEEVVGADCEYLAEEVSGMFEDSGQFVERVNELIAECEPVDGEELALADGRTFERTHRPIDLTAGEGHLWMYRNVTDHKSRERELETVQRQFEAVLKNTTTPMFMKDDAGKYIFVNRAYRDLFDLQDEEIVGRTDHEIHPPEMAAEVQKNDQAVIERGEPVETEERIVIEGEERTFLSTKVPIYDTGERSDPDTPVATFGVATDITDRKEAEQQLREEQQFVQSIFQSLPDPLYAFDTDGHPIRWNEKLEDVTGYSSTEIEEMHVTEFVPDDEIETIATNFRTVLDERRSVTIESAFKTNDGTRISYEFTGGPLEAADGTISGITGIGRDITERMAREQQLEALNRVTQELMSAKTRDEVVEIGIETTRDHLGIDVNAIHLYDEDTEGLVPVAATDAVYDLIGESPTFTDDDSIAWRVYQRGEPLAVDDIHEDPDRYNPDTPIRSELYLPLGEYGILLAGSPSPETFDEQDVLMGGILASGLTTALEQVERTEQLRTRERELTKQNDRLEEFASVVSHDLRNPLTVASGRLELAAAECDSEHLEHVEKAHERMQTLIEDLLTLAREGETVTDLEAVALAPLIEGCWTNVETGEATLVTDIDCPVQADKSRLKQLFENLVRNSVEHGGENVTVTVGELDDGFYIEDDGPGIPPDEREHIFEAGYSTSKDGTGFGLSIVKQIVDAHGWNIQASEGSEGGARFEITGVEFVSE